MIGILEKLTGMDTLSDDVIAMDFLISAKAGIRNYAIAATETATPEIKAVLRKHLEEAIETHERISNYLISRGLYHPHDVGEQVKTDRKLAGIALTIPS